MACTPPALYDRAVILAPMSEPTLTILGVYRPHISEGTWKEHWRVTGDDTLTNDHFAGLVLIEAIIDGLNEPFDMRSFGQMSADHPNDSRHMQVGYDEALVSADGEILIQREMNCIHGTSPLRFAVFLHYYAPDRPLLWQHGEVTCPPIQDAPIRLTMLVPYNACT
jgi:hypothetical protein